MCRPAEPVYDEAKAEAMSTDQRSTVASRNTGTHISSTPDCGVTTPLEMRPSSAPVSAGSVWGSSPLSSTHFHRRLSATEPVDDASAMRPLQTWESRPSGSICTVPTSCAPGVSGISCRPPAYRRRKIHTRPPADDTPAAITVGHIST